MRNAGDSLIVKVKDGENGEKFVELGKTRRATVRAFNGVLHSVVCVYELNL